MKKTKVIILGGGVGTSRECLIEAKHRVHPAEAA
jgi:hypothetical protein